MTSPFTKPAAPSSGPAPASNQVTARRVAIMGAVLLALFAVVFFRLWFLQVLSGNSLAAQATQNRIRNLPITPPRGQILDRRAHTIVSNKRVQVVELDPSTLPAIERAAAREYGKTLGTWYALRAAERKLKPRPQLTTLTDPQVVTSYTKADALPELTDLRGRYRRLGELLELSPDAVRGRVIRSYYREPYSPAALTRSAQPDQVNYVAENSELYEGVTVGERFARTYPLKGIGAQLLGQVGPVPIDEDTGKSSIDKYEKLNPATLVGLSGLEYQYNGELAGHEGTLRTHVNVDGDVVGASTEIKPIAGNSLQLTLDNDLQRTAQNAIAAGSRFNPGGKPAAAFAMDPRDGKILASVSGPTYNPNELAGISDERFAQLTDPEGDHPLFNRVLAGAYPAGSTFKPATAFAALDSGVTTTTQTVFDPGFIKISDTTYTNAKREPNGSVALRKAIQRSSDVYFYEMGQRMNALKGLPLQKWARRLGYGRRTGVDLPGERAGTIPDPQWRIGLNKLERPCRIKNHIPLTPGTYGCRFSDMRTWSVGDEVGLSVGQGDVQVTPMQSAVMYAAIANGGQIVTPHLGDKILNRAGETVQTLAFRKPPPITLDPAALRTIQDGLYDAANEPGGTSQEVFADWPGDRYPVHGKTGTAERGEGREDQAWYAAYVPDKTRPIVVVTTVEDGGFGAETAAPIAAEILKAWYHVRDVDISSGSSTTN